MKLGAFSLSLNVKDIEKSKLFYEDLGFDVLAGSLERQYLIMKNESTLIGLFQGMFEGNILTFNPGWDSNGKEINPFTDIREIANELNAKGYEFSTPPIKSEEGPASFMLTDPDGNVILMDQHR